MNENKIETNKEEAYEVIHCLANNGFEAYLAGGCVRDELLNNAPKDYDVATNAKPAEIEKIFSKTLNFAKKYGVIIVFFSKTKKTVEVTTFRKDFGYKDGRRPDYVVFGSLEEDYQRRDFTINALYKDIFKNQIIDFCGGLDDIKNKIVRCVGNAEERFNEDKLRILRAARFAGNLGFTIEPQTYSAAQKFIGQFQCVSFERINEELTKMFTRKNADLCLKILDEIGILKIILPEIADCKGISQPLEYHPEGDVFEHILKMFEFANYPISKILAFSILLHDVGKPLTYSQTDRIRFNGHDRKGAELAEKILKRLRFSKKEIAIIKNIIANHMKFINVPKMKSSTIQKFVLSENFDIELELHRLDCLASHQKLDTYNFLVEKRKEFEYLKKLPKPLITGKNLIDNGLKPGPIFKKILNDVYNWQLENKIEDKQRALDYLKNIISEKSKKDNNEKFHNYLIDILQVKKESISKIKIESVNQKQEKRSILKIFENKRTPVIIAEIKKASPSLGIIADDFNFENIFEVYNTHKAVDAVSILTEEKFFHGNIEYIKQANKTSVKPLLRKDFIIDEKQIYETASSGADLLLLIASILTEYEYKHFYELGKSLGLEIITEIHTLEELKMVEKYSPEIIGINNRNLKTFKVDLTISEELLKYLKRRQIVISESGIKSADDIKKLFQLGARGFLIGELIMKNKNIHQILDNITL